MNAGRSIGVAALVLAAIAFRNAGAADHVGEQIAAKTYVEIADALRASHYACDVATQIVVLPDGENNQKAMLVWCDNGAERYMMASPSDYSSVKIVQLTR